jgi:hypothetical protein
MLLFNNFVGFKLNEKNVHLILYKTINKMEYEYI